MVRLETSGFPCLSLEQFHRLSNHAVMKDLMHSADCTMVHIAMESSEYSAESYSPMSVMALALLESLLDYDSSVHVIHFFSGAHSDSSDDLHGVSGMLRSLVFQTLSQFRYDLDDAITPWLDDQLQCGAFIGYCQLLCELILQLPPEVTLFYVVDQVQLCQIGDEEELLEELVEELGSLMRKLRLRAVLKVLMIGSGSRPLATTGILETIILSGDLAQDGQNLSPEYLRARLEGTDQDWDGLRED